MNPYQLLGITAESDDASVRGRYLELVKRYPPERYPDKFNQIHTAYNALKDEKSRLQYYLFNDDTWVDSPFEALLDYFSMAEKRTPQDFKNMKEFLKKCAII